MRLTRILKPPSRGSFSCSSLQWGGGGKALKLVRIGKFNDSIVKDFGMRSDWLGVLGAGLPVSGSTRLVRCSRFLSYTFRSFVWGQFLSVSFGCKTTTLLMIDSRVCGVGGSGRRYTVWATGGRAGTQNLLEPRGLFIRVRRALEPANQKI